MPNPWDPGSAKILASMGFPALATTSAGFANALGRTDGAVTRDEAIAHARLIGHATSQPIKADLENGFGDEPKDVAQTIEEALAAGLAGCSIEDFGSGSIYPRELAIERIRAAVEVNRRSDSKLLLTARAENFFGASRISATPSSASRPIKRRVPTSSTRQGSAGSKNFELSSPRSIDR